MAQATQTAPRARGPVTGTAMATRRRRSFLADLYGTAVGKKYAMAITGLMLVGFVVAHMVGNLKMYLGASHLNDYADRKSTRLNSSHIPLSRMPSSA